MTSLGVVVPAFRPDVDRLETYLESIDATLAPDALRVELDAPTPDTEAALRRLDLASLSVHTAPERRGKGAAVTAGFEALDTDRLAFSDADGSTPASELGRVVDALADADLAVGSRRHPDATVVGHQTLGRRFLGDGFAWLARRLLAADLHDYQCGAKAITADAWSVVRGHLYEPGFAWDVELVAMAAALDCRVVEAPIEWEDQPGSTVDPVSTAMDLGVALITARHRAKRIGDSRLHDAIADRRAEETALVDRVHDGRGGSGQG
jgi:glycosyltransferase involved in cell wall biosynthesis